MTYKIVIPCRMPNLNDFISAQHIVLKWKQKGKVVIASLTKGDEMKKSWQKKCTTIIRNTLKGKKLKTPVHIHYHYFEINKQRDKGNIHGFVQKVFEDALQDAGALNNDGWNDIENFEPEYDVDARNPRIEITITEVN